MGIQMDEEGQSTKGLAEIILAKNRNGPTDEVILRFKEERALFVEPDDFEESDVVTGGPGGVYTMGSKMNDDISSNFSDFSFNNNIAPPPFD
jgi:replicative DNA helicase